jgi:hypothetical protein
MEEEAAKAMQEVAKTTSKAIDAAEKLGGFLSKVIGGALIELGGTLQDWAKYFRYKNLLRIQDRVEEIHASRQLQGKTTPIPPRYAIPLIQRASEEDDPTIQELWAALIANATDPNRHLNLNKVLLDVLASIEPLDVAILRFLKSQGWLMHRNVPGGGVNVAGLVMQVGAKESDVRLSLQNLNRLGLVGDEFEATYKDIDTTSFGLRVTRPETTFRPSPLGFALMKACEP